MEIVFKIKADRVKIDEEALKMKIAQTVLQRRAAIIAEEIFTRTQGGRDADGGPIGSGSYSESYKKAIRAGKVAGKVNTAPVNLSATGQLLQSIQVRPIRSGAEIYFAGTHVDRRNKNPRRGSSPGKRPTAAGAKKSARVKPKRALGGSRRTSSRRRRSQSNKDLAKHLQSRGFKNWFFLSPKQFQDVRDDAKKITDISIKTLVQIERGAISS